MKNDNDLQTEEIRGSSNTQNKPGRKLQVFGIIVGLATIFGALIAAIEYLPTDSTSSVRTTIPASIHNPNNLIAEIEQHSIKLPNADIIRFLDYTEEIYVSGLKYHLEDPKFTSKLDKTSSSLLIRQLKELRSDAHMKKWRVRQFFDETFQSIWKFYRVSIDNKGKIPLTGIFLRFPDIDLISKNVKRGTTGDEIMIGTLKEKTEKIFYIWGSERFGSANLEDVVLGHNNGVGQVIIKPK